MQRAGVRAGDRIVGINGVNVGASSHRDMINLIRRAPGRLRLLLASDGASGSCCVT